MYKSSSKLEFRLFSRLRVTCARIRVWTASISKGFPSLLLIASWKYAARSTAIYQPSECKYEWTDRLKGWSFFLLADATLTNLSSRINALRSRWESLEFSWRAFIFPLFLAIFLRVFSKLFGMVSVAGWPRENGRRSST